MTYDQYVEVLGQVKLPGKYYFKQGTYLSKILELSGGFEDSTFSKSVFFDKGEIVEESFKRFEDVIPFNIKEVIEKKSDIPLHNLDKIVVHANVNYFDKKPVQILGEVGIPGSYPVLKDDESLERLLIELVDLQKKSFVEGIKIFRDSLSLAWQSLSIPLIPGDSASLIKAWNSICFWRSL